MARGRGLIRTSFALGGAALALLLALSLGSLIAVALRGAGVAGFGPADWAALRFTLWQAALSALLSGLLAVPVARALARRRFVGRRALITALGAPFLLPVLVATMGLLAVFGRSGRANRVLAALGLPELSIYGPEGVIIAHVFLNLPLAVRLLLGGWATIPAERFRLAASLDLSGRDIARLIEWPMLRQTLPGAILAIFLICLTSFAVALTMGGGPRATTLELAIFQAFRLDFDLAHAASLAGVQMLLSLTVALACLRAVRATGFGAGLDRPVERWDVDGWPRRVVDGLSIGLCALFLLLPLSMVLVGGLPHIAGLPGAVWPALGRSVVIALGATGLALLLALALGMMIIDLPTGPAHLADAAVMLMLTVSPLVLGTGLFLILQPLVSPVDWALWITGLVNAAMALPFCLRAILPAMRTIRRDYDRLADSLDLSGGVWLRWIVLPRLRGPLGFSGGLAAALSMGDLGVVALFSDPARTTLPMQVYALSSAYRLDQAAGAAVVLMLASFALFWAFDRWGNANAAD
ncbi:MAG: thiamine/thiamine pyrophosphate ABC transporter permease ThiP [Paracoccaceae bacterium]